LASTDAPKAPLRKKAVHELKEFAIVTAFLYVCFSSLTLLKVAILHGEGISYTPYGLAAVKAVILAKFILIGQGLHIGGEYASRPLIWPTISKAFAFFLFLCVLTIIEEVVVGTIHGLSVSASLAELSGAHLAETLVRIFILFLILVPYFAFRTLGELLGEGNLAKLFFVERGRLTYHGSAQSSA
jgi:hypothetical protein